MDTALDTQQAAPEAAPENNVAPESSASTSFGEVSSWEDSPISRIYNPDGTQKEGAADVFKELGFESEAGTVLRNGAGLFDSFKQHATTHKSFREKQEGTVKVPNAEASEEERQEFFGKLGASTNSEDYSQKLFADELPEGIAKDEVLASFVSEWAAKNPVNTPESLGELAQQFLEHQVGQAKAHEEEYQAEYDKNVQDTRMQLKTELGGDKAFHDFAQGIKSFLVSDSAKSLGFQFENGDGGLHTSNPLHAQMLNDPAALKMLSALSSKNMPSSLPSGAAVPPTAQERDARRQELVSKNPNGWQSKADFDEYQALVKYG